MQNHLLSLTYAVRAFVKSGLSNDMNNEGAECGVIKDPLLSE